MALKRVIRKELYQYTEELRALTEQDEKEARDLFCSYKQQNIILNESFDDDIWRLTNQISNVNFDFRLGEDMYTAKAAKEIGCTYRRFCTTVRIYAVNNLHYSLSTIRGHISAIMQFARSAEVPNTDFTARVVSNFLELLPGNTTLRDRVCMRAYCRTEQTAKSPRGLVEYISYFRFSHYLNLFWTQATPNEKLLYFPIFLWWCLTSILPLRVTEFILTPRQCIVKRENAWMIRVRRTKLKGKNAQAKHTIADDYEILEYPIRDDLASEINVYIDATEDEYASDIDSIFSKRTQLRLTNLPFSNNNTNYTTNNLYQLLNRFYTDIMQLRYSLNLVEPDVQPGKNEINRIRLGDARHVAIINLMVSGSSLVACRELSGHLDVYSAQNYYSNVRAFLEALNFEYLTPQRAEKALPQYTSYPEHQLLVSDLGLVTQIPAGMCASARYKDGDYSDCALAVDSYGHIGACSHCKYLIPNHASLVDYSEAADCELKKACALIREALNSYRTDKGVLPGMEGILNKLQTAAAQYLRLSVVERQIILEGGNYERK